MGKYGRRLHLLVEGQTEESVVRDELRPYLARHDIWVTYSLIATKRPAGGPNFKGGVTNWPKLERELRLLLRDSSLDMLSTVIDYYGFPDDGPGMRDRPVGDAYSRITHVEQAMAAVIGDRRFIPHLALHELETWVFASGDELGALHGDPALSRKLAGDVMTAGGPELVNDGPGTAPSKRLATYCPGYSKTLDGPIVIAEVGIVEIRRTCPHLDDWLTTLGA